MPKRKSRLAMKNPPKRKCVIQEDVAKVDLVVVPAKLEEEFPELNTTNGRRARNKAIYIQWCLNNPGKCKFGDRDQVYNGDAFCTRGELVKSDLFMQNGRVKSRALSSAMVSRHREIKLAEHGIVEEKDE